jgi:hypothetical protein
MIEVFRCRCAGSVWRPSGVVLAFDRIRLVINDGSENTVDIAPER